MKQVVIEVLDPWNAQNPIRAFLGVQECVHA
jgi:hypothetical protein